MLYKVLQKGKLMKKNKQGPQTLLNGVHVDTRMVEFYFAFNTVGLFSLSQVISQLLKRKKERD